MGKKQTIKNDSKQALIKNDSKQGNLTKRLNPEDTTKTFKTFKASGSEGSGILIGLYYKGSAKLSELKGISSANSCYNAAKRLERKGYILKNGPICFLTDKGRDLVAPFIEYARNTQPAY